MTLHELNTDCWTFRGDFEEPRLSEMISLYEELGFSVKLAPFITDHGKACQKCFEITPGRFSALYTKKIDSE